MEELSAETEAKENKPSHFVLGFSTGNSLMFSEVGNFIISEGP
jgi:hypothetical protein